MGEMKKFILAAVVATMAVLNVQSATHAKVQLWEGGPYWATTNIGADNPWDYGLYFWCGDTIGHRPSADGKFSFNFSNGNSAIYTSGRSVSELQSAEWVTSDGVLTPAHDAAHVHWGGVWRMPTMQELSDLCSKCDWAWTTLNGVKGYVVCGRGGYASNSIFLPCAGYGGGAWLRNAGSVGYYWSSVPYSGSSGAAHELFFSDYQYLISYGGRYDGFSVRPVQGFGEGAPADFVVHFNANGGTGNMDEQTFEEGNEQKLSKNTYRKDGYVFQGWAVVADGEVVYKDEASITIDSDMTLYAVWANPPLTLTAESADWSSGSIKLRWNAEDYPDGTTFKVLRTSGGETLNEVATGISGPTWSDTNFLAAGTSPFDRVSYQVEPELSDISQSLRSSPVHTRNRRALCVGIDKYDDPDDNLEYCVSDARGWRDMLRKHGCFTTAYTIEDYSANKEKILSELSECAETALPGDVFVYTHSSHGDTNVLYCHDNDLTAAEFASALMKFPKGTGLIVVLDTCSSGSIPNTPPVRISLASSLSLSAEPTTPLSFVESVMAAMESVQSLKASSVRLTATSGGAVRETISSGREIGWLTAVNEVQDSVDGAFSCKCLQTDGWRCGGADRVDNGGNGDGKISFWELGLFADYWFGQRFDQYGMSPQKFSADILEAVLAGSVPSLSTVAIGASSEVVTSAIAAAGFADEAAVEAAICGSAAEYTAFKAWAGSVKIASGGAVAGEAMVIANTNAAAAYLLGAERLFDNAPKVEFGEVEVLHNADISQPDCQIGVAVTVKDGEEAVTCAAEKVKEMFEATSDLGDWNGAAKLTPTVSVETGEGATMRFKVTPGDGTATRAFLRIRK